MRNLQVLKDYGILKLVQFEYTSGMYQNYLKDLLKQIAGPPSEFLIQRSGVELKSLHF